MNKLVVLRTTWQDWNHSYWMRMVCDVSLGMATGWSDQCLLPCIFWSTLYRCGSSEESCLCGLNFRIVKNALYLKHKEIYPRAPKDVTYWRFVVSWIVIFVINVMFMWIFLFFWNDWLVLLWWDRLYFEIFLFNGSKMAFLKVWNLQIDYKW